MFLSRAKTFENVSVISKDLTKNNTHKCTMLLPIKEIVSRKVFCYTWLATIDALFFLCWF